VLDHITIRCADRAASERFYDTALRTIGIERSGRDDEYTVWQGQFSLAAADGDHPITRNLHLAFETTDNATVDAFHASLTKAGYGDNGPPGERDYHPGYYGAFVLDPDGNNVEVVNHNRS
jgi:catechol 2,3-dioxygenase-like lactoylglutathione lyase family enzyme